MNSSPNCPVPLVFWWGRVGLYLLRRIWKNFIVVLEFLLQRDIFCWNRNKSLWYTAVDAPGILQWKEACTWEGDLYKSDFLLYLLWFSMFKRYLCYQGYILHHWPKYPLKLYLVLSSIEKEQNWLQVDKYLVCQIDWGPADRAVKHISNETS